MDQKKLTERRVAVVGGLTGCPVCGSFMSQKDLTPNSIFRNPDDLAAVNFNCGAEISVDGEGDCISRIACPGPSDDAADNINEATEAEIEEGETDETQSV